MTSLSNVLNLNEDGRWAGWGHLDARISAAYKIENSKLFTKAGTHLKGIVLSAVEGWATTESLRTLNKWAICSRLIFYF